MRNQPQYGDFPAAGCHSGNKSVKSDITYQRYTDWDSTSCSTIVDARDEHSSNSYERRAAYTVEDRDDETLNRRPGPQHEHHLRRQTGSSTQRGRMSPQEHFVPPLPANPMQSHAQNAEDETSVRTSITNSRSVTSPERRRRNSRYEPAASKASYSGSTVGSRDGMPTVVRTRSKNPPRSEASIEPNHHHGSMSQKSDRVSKQPSNRTEVGGFPSVNSISDESRLLGQSNCYSSVGTYTIVSNKPPLGPRSHNCVQDTTPRANNTTSLDTIENRIGKLRQSNTSISSFTRDDETLTLENSIPSALEFSNQSIRLVSCKSECSTIDQNDIKYWMDLSVHAAVSILQAKGSETIAEKAATTVVEAGQKIKLREKKRDMQQVLRFLATKTSVAVLEAGGNQKVATAVAHAIMTFSPSNDKEHLSQDEVDRSAMINQIDKSIGENIKKKSVSRISELSEDQRDRLSEKVNKTSTKAHTQESTQEVVIKMNATQKSDNTFSSATSKKSNGAMPFTENPLTKSNTRSKTPEIANQKSSISKNSDLTISHSNISFDKPCQHDGNNSHVRRQTRGEAVKLDAQKEWEINEKMAALDAATNALLAKANNVQHYIDHVVQKQPTDASYFRAPGSKEFQTVFTCDDPGFHNNFNGRSFQIDDQYRHNPHPNHNKEKSVLEKLTSGFSQMLEFTACATPTTGTQASSANFTTQYSAPVNRNVLPRLDCNEGIVDSNYSEAYAYSEKNDDTNDMISALTDDVPVHKKWQQHSRLHLVTDHERLDNYAQANRGNHFLEPPQIETCAADKPIVTSHIDLMPNKVMTHQEPMTYQDPSQSHYSTNPTFNTDHLPHPTKESMHQAFDSAMHQLSSQMIQEPFNERQDVVLVSPSEIQKSNKTSSSGIGKLKSALSRKKNNHKSVSFGIATDDLHVNTRPPKSPGRKFGGFGRRKQEHTEC